MIGTLRAHYILYFCVILKFFYNKRLLQKNGYYETIRKKSKSDNFQAL